MADEQRGRDERGCFTRGNAFSYQSGSAWRGNPNGRPKRKTFSELFYDELQKELSAEQRCLLEERYGDRLADLNGSTKMEVLAKLLVDAALERGDLQAFREIADRLDPKPRRVEMSGREGTPIPIAQLSKEMTAEDELYRAAVAGAAED